MATLRPLTPRPELVVGDDNSRVQSPDTTNVGRAGPVARERCIFAIPLNGSGPVQLARITAISGGGAYLADPLGNVIGEPKGVWCHRILYARWTEDTRRLAG
jgi:hypothetical protein